MPYNAWFSLLRATSILDSDVWAKSKASLFFSTSCISNLTFTMACIPESAADTPSSSSKYHSRLIVREST